MYRADHAFDRHRNWLTADLTRPPSEYFRENVYVTFQDDFVAFQVTELLNHERLMWANDHPHSDATWPESQSVVAEHTARLSAQVRDDILWRNCARLYNLEVPNAVEVSR
jgi:predicted TIM-barrel fold metal-dependent hydrolase